MLILTRKPGESIRIGDDIVVAVMGVNGNQVRVGIEAPRDVNIARQELTTPKKSPREEAA